MASEKNVEQKEIFHNHPIERVDNVEEEILFFRKRILLEHTYALLITKDVSRPASFRPSFLSSTKLRIILYSDEGLFRITVFYYRDDAYEIFRRLYEFQGAAYTHKNGA